MTGNAFLSFVPGRIIVCWQKNLDKEQLQKLIKSLSMLGLEQVKWYDDINASLIKVKEGEEDDWMRIFYKMRLVRFVFRDHIGKTTQ